MKRVILAIVLLMSLEQVTRAQELDIFKWQASPTMEGCENLAKNFSVYSYPEIRREDLVWSKVVYRVIDLREKVNQPLYYPIDPISNRKNLFTTLFDLLVSGKVKGYAYDEFSESFSPDNELDVLEDLLNPNNIPYEEKRDELTNEIMGYKVDPYDIPSADVLKFYVKEVWHFDKHSSRIGNRILAICPVWEKIANDGVPQKIPVCWFNYSEMERYLATARLVVDDKNSTAELSFDAVFKKRMFNGYIYKEGGVENRTLLEYCFTRGEVAKEQMDIENSIIEIESNMWEY